MALYPCKPSKQITPTSPLLVGLYRCWLKEEEQDTYLKQFRVDQTATTFEIIKGGS